MRRAAEICGEEALARELGVTVTVLNVWLKGLAEPPADVFLKIADILGDFSLQELRDQHRSALPASEPDSVS
jgi:DNA-binding transcriptional regulator YdaS (Cro superfamily)